MCAMCMISALRWETSLTQHINQSHSARLQASTVRELSCVPTASHASSSAPGVQTVHACRKPCCRLCGGLVHVSDILASAANTE